MAADRTGARYRLEAARYSCLESCECSHFRDYRRTSVENSHTEDDCDRADIRAEDIGGKWLLGRRRGTAVARCSE